MPSITQRRTAPFSRTGFFEYRPHPASKAVISGKNLAAPIGIDHFVKGLDVTPYRSGFNDGAMYKIHKK